MCRIAKTEYNIGNCDVNLARNCIWGDPFEANPEIQDKSMAGNKILSLETLLDMVG
ncbi:hypothetical protein D3C76_1582450 [compost metagenome]